MPEPNDPVVVHHTESAREARELSLVLQARGVPFARAQQRGRHLLLVPAHQAERAAREIAGYLEENRDWPRRPTLPALLSGGGRAAAVWAAVLALPFALELRWPALRLGELGRVDAARVRAGEAWRAATALTLHADLLHLAGNLVFGALFTALACQLVGTGVGLLGILAAGACGNLANSWLQGPEHLSVGASTAVFAALGLQTAFLRAQRRKLGYSAMWVWAPLILGLVFLAFLGMPQVAPDEVLEFLRAPPRGQRTDFTAHATGFAAGIALGLGAGGLPAELLASARVQRAAGALACAVLTAAWATALASGG